MKSLFFQQNGNHSLKHNSGAMAVEFALVAPIFFLILFATVELGMYLHDRQVLTNAAREAARFGIVMKNPRPEPEDIQQIALDFSDMLLLKASLVCPELGDACTGISVSTPDPVIPGNALTVAITAGFSFPLLSAFTEGSFSTAIPVTGTSIMIVE